MSSVGGRIGFGLMAVLAFAGAAAWAGFAVDLGLLHAEVTALPDGFFRMGAWLAAALVLHLPGLVAARTLLRRYRPGAGGATFWWLVLAPPLAVALVLLAVPSVYETGLMVPLLWVAVLGYFAYGLALSRWSGGFRRLGGNRPLAAHGRLIAAAGVFVCLHAMAAGGTLLPEPVATVAAHAGVVVMACGGAILAAAMLALGLALARAARRGR